MHKDRTAKRTNNFWRLLLVLACLAAIGYFSNQPFYEQDLRPKIKRHERVVERVQKLPPMQFSYDNKTVDNRNKPVDFIHFWIRKGAHVLVYGMLGLALVATLGSMGVGGVRRWIYAGLLLAMVAILDEWNQTTVPDRTGRAVDVFVDLLGFILFGFIAWMFAQARKFLVWPGKKPS